MFVFLVENCGVYGKVLPCIQWVNLVSFIIIFIAGCFLFLFLLPRFIQYWPCLLITNRSTQIRLQNNGALLVVRVFKHLLKLYLVHYFWNRLNCFVILNRGKIWISLPDHRFALYMDCFSFFFTVNYKFQDALSLFCAYLLISTK